MSFRSCIVTLRSLIVPVQAAEAEAEKNYLEGKGIAKSRKEIMKGMKEAVADFQKDIGDARSNEAFIAAKMKIVCVQK